MKKTTKLMIGSILFMILGASAGLIRDAIYVNSYPELYPTDIQSIHEQLQDAPASQSVKEKAIELI